MHKTELLLINPCVSGEQLPQVSHLTVHRKGDAQSDLPGRLINVQNCQNQSSHRLLWDWKGNTEERVEGVRLSLTVRAGEAGSELSLEDVHHEAVVTPRVVGQALRGHHVIRAAGTIFQSFVFLLRGRVELLVNPVQEPQQELLSVMLASSLTMNTVNQQANIYYS